VTSVGVEILLKKIRAKVRTMIETWPTTQEVDECSGEGV